MCVYIYIYIYMLYVYLHCDCIIFYICVNLLLFLMHVWGLKQGKEQVPQHLRGYITVFSALCQSSLFDFPVSMLPFYFLISFIVFFMQQYTHSTSVMYILQFFLLFKFAVLQVHTCLLIYK